MKNIAFILTLFLIAGNSVFAQVGINADNSDPDPSAGLDVSFSNRGLLPPRVELTSINSASPVTDPAAGLLVYNTASTGTSPNNVMPGYYSWNGTKWIPVSAPQGINVGDMQYWNGAQWVRVAAGSNGQVLTVSNGIPAWVQSPTYCGFSITINHLVAGGVAPVNKFVTYGTVSNVPGTTTKCWITSNLGADHQGTAVDDGTEASSGWYWQFNRKQGYKHDGTTRTPNSAWISVISESSDWTMATDPCALELSNGWRLPTYSEWSNTWSSGGWNNWNGPWNSPLKLHAAGRLVVSDGSLVLRGSYGYYSGSTQSGVTNGCIINFTSSMCSPGYLNKAGGFAIRCLKD